METCSLWAYRCQPGSAREKDSYSRATRVEYTSLRRSRSTLICGCAQSTHPEEYGSTAAIEFSGRLRTALSTFLLSGPPCGAPRTTPGVISRRPPTTKSGQASRRVHGTRAESRRPMAVAKAGATRIAPKATVRTAEAASATPAAATNSSGNR